ncbi:MAG TPA: type I polyketide synthase, partial [Labilithrix sp.]|nr:type I polyketide synthase [Labilithrix sp.]
APSPRAQQAVLLDACAAAGVAPSEVQYVEAHGTGTRLGDPIEAGALGAVLGMGRATERALRIGSVKTNIGHLEAAAGIAGLLKVVLTMHHRTFVPSLHFERPNPHIAFASLGVRVQTDVAKWNAENGRLLAGVSSFGFGGTNCHVVLEKTIREPARLFAVSAASEDSLRSEVQRVADLLRADATSVDAACRTSGTEGDWMLAVSAKTAPDLERQLRSFLDGVPSNAVSAGRVDSRRPRIAFVFGGQGSQWVGMGRALLEREPVARAVLSRCDRAFRAHVPWSLVSRLREGNFTHFEDVAFVQPAIFALQIALAAVWRARGVMPEAVVGQSMGEVAAAHVAGALSLEDASRVICLRSRVISTANVGGKMAVVGLSLAATEDVLAPFAGKVSVAVSSAPDSTVIGGDAAAVDELVSTLEKRGVFCRLVRVDYASHTARMDPLLPELRELLAPVAPRQASLAMYSTVTAAKVEGQALDAAYWAANLREPVLFAAAIERLAAAGVNTFIEVDPHAVVDQNVAQCLLHGRYAGVVVSSARRDESECDTLLDVTGRLLLAGVSVGVESRGSTASESGSATIVALSAKSARALGAQARRLREYIVAHAEL